MTFSHETKRRDWKVAGTAYYATAEAFGDRIAKANRRRETARKRALFADTKANRKLYGTPSANFRFTPMPSSATDLPPWLAAWPAAITDAVSK
jgi:histidinol-phosphate/aromatic aminotransferase/cobyric acid decarboxylase-like protein